MRGTITRASKRAAQPRNRWNPAVSAVQRRHVDENFVPSMMPIVKQKWDAIEVIKTTTETMKNIAAGKLPFVERQLRLVRPYASIVAPFFELDEPLEGQKPKKIIHVGASTERGLCGIIAGNVPRLVEKNVKAQKKADKIENVTVMYGKKGFFKSVAMFKTCNYGFVNMKMRDPNFTYICDTMGQVLKEHPDWDEMRVYYNTYRSSQSFALTEVLINKLDICKEIAKVQFPLYEVEGDEACILENLLEHKIACQVYGALAENSASEQGARLQSMDGAVKACKERSEEYQKIYNKLRQTKITSELVILSAGVKCLEMAKGNK